MKSESSFASDFKLFRSYLKESPFSNKRIDFEKINKNIQIDLEQIICHLQIYTNPFLRKNFEI